MKKLLLLSTCYLSFFNYNAEAMDTPASEDAPKTTMGTQLAPPKAPLTTGFFDKTLSDSTIEKEEKLKRAVAHVTPRKEKYELFLEQIGSTYFRTKFLQDETLKNLALYIMSYFEEKLERLEKKHIHFQSYLEDVSHFTKERNSANPIGMYSGKFRGDQAAQAKYAHTKIKTWELIFSFVDQFPLPKASTNPIIRRAIEAEAQRRVAAFGELSIINPNKLTGLKKTSTIYYQVSDVENLSTSAKQNIENIALQHPVRKLNDIIDNSYDLKTYSEAHLKKWRTRIGETQKINILGDLLKSLSVTHNQLEGRAGNPLAIEGPTVDLARTEGNF